MSSVGIGTIKNVFHRHVQRRKKEALAPMSKRKKHPLNLIVYFTTSLIQELSSPIQSRRDLGIAIKKSGNDHLNRPKSSSSTVPFPR